MTGQLRRVLKAVWRRKDKALRGVYSRSGALARVARFPLPWFAPWRRSQIHIRRDKGLGDVLMCTPALREIKRRNPRAKLHFYTSFPELVRGIPYIDQVGSPEQAPPNSRMMWYEDATPPQVHLSHVLGDRVGLEVTDTTPDCAIDPGLVEHWRTAWADLPRPHILVLKRASNWTPNKNWQDELWDTLIASITASGTVIEVGEPDGQPSSGPSHIDLRGQTSMAQLVAAVAAADLYVGPISGPMHIAAAVRTPAVVIVGGYEDPRGVQYKGQTYLYSPVPCAPCWLREPCPFNRKCLSAIRPETVESYIREALKDPRASVQAPPRIVNMPV